MIFSVFLVIPLHAAPYDAVQVTHGRGGVIAGSSAVQQNRIAFNNPQAAQNITSGPAAPAAQTTNTATDGTVQEDTEARIAELRARSKDLEAEIADTNTELLNCNKTKANWTIATIAGAAGTVGTGIGAAVQLKQIHDAKKKGLVEGAKEQKPEEKTE